MPNCLCMQSRNSNSFVSEESARKSSVNVSDVYVHGRAMVHENDKHESQNGSSLESESHHEVSHSAYSSQNGSNGHENGKDFIQNGVSHSEMTEAKGPAKAKKAPYSLGSKSSKLPKLIMKENGEQFCAERERKGQGAESSK